MRLIAVTLLSSLIFFVLFDLKASNSMTVDLAQNIISRELIFPAPVYKRISIPGESLEDRKLIDELLFAGYVRKDLKRDYSIRPGMNRIIRILRNYPNYHIYGIQIKLCDVSVEIQSVKVFNGFWKVLGKTIAKSSRGLENIKGLSDLIKKNAGMRKGVGGLF